MYGAFGRDFATRDGRRVMVVAISLNQWQSLVDATGIGEHLPADRARLRRRLPPRGGPLPRPGGDRARSMAPWFEARTLDEVRERARPPRRVLGPVPDVHPAAATTTGACRRGARCSRASTSPASARCSPRRRPCGSPPSRRCPRPPHRCSARTPTRCSPTCMGLSATEIGRLHDDGLVATRRRERATPTGLADAGFAERARRAGVGGARARGSPPPRRRPGRARRGRAPAPWHWACFLPDAADRGARPRRPPGAAPRDGRVPQPHVGRRPGARPRAAPTRRRAPRASRIASADRKEGAAGAFWLVTVEHTVSAGRRGVRRGAPGHRVPRRRRPRPRPAPTPPAPDGAVGRGAGRRTAVAVPLLGAHLQHPPHPLRPPVRDRRRGVPRPRRARTAHRDAALPSSPARAPARGVAALDFRARAPLFANRTFWLAGEPTDDGCRRARRPRRRHRCDDLRR